jgi:hypothetical protein
MTHVTRAGWATAKFMTEKNEKLLRQVEVVQELINSIFNDKENDSGIKEAALHANMGLLKLEMELLGDQTWRKYRT